MMLVDELKKEQIHLEAAILPAIATGKIALAWHHKIQPMILALNGSLEWSEMILTKHGIPKET